MQQRKILVTVYTFYIQELCLKAKLCKSGERGQPDTNEKTLMIGTSKVMVTEATPLSFPTVVKPFSSPFILFDVKVQCVQCNLL